MRKILLVIWCILIAVLIGSGCLSPDGYHVSEKNETIVTPFGDVVLINDIPRSPDKTPIFTVSKSQYIRNEPTTEIQESGPWKGFPIPFTATEEWSLQSIRNNTENAHVVTRDYTNFGIDGNTSYVSSMGVSLGVNRTPRTQEFASAVIANSMWKGIPEIRTEIQTLNETGNVGMKPLRTLLRNLDATEVPGGLDDSIFPLVVDHIEPGYFHRVRQGRCGDVHVWEPTWILTGTARNGTRTSLWIWAEENEETRLLLDTVQPLSGVPEIIIYTGDGVQFTLPPSGRILPFPPILSAPLFDKVDSEIRGSFWVHPLPAYPLFPRTMMVFRDVSVLNEDTARNISHNLGMNGTPEASERIIWIRDKSRELSVMPGNIGYDLLNRPNGAQDEINLTPTKEEARVLAIDFLIKSGLYEPDTIPDMYIGGGGTFTNETAEIHYQTMRVYFPRTIDGIPVIENSISVEVGGNGDIVEVRKKWSEFRPDREYPLISPEEAYLHLLKSDMIDGYEMALGSLYMNLRTEKCGYENIGPLIVNVNRVSLAYFGGDTQESDLLRPAYKFEYEFIVEDRHLPAVFFVPAVPELGVFEDWNYEAPV